MGYRVFKVYKVGYKVSGIFSRTKSILQGLQGEIQGFWYFSRTESIFQGLIGGIQGFWYFLKD